MSNMTRSYFYYNYEEFNYEEQFYYLMQLINNYENE